MRKLINKLKEASYAYYGKDKPVMTDKQYDELYDKLIDMENETGIVYSDSPTQKVQGFIMDGLAKVTHTKPMLSANKTKDIVDIRRFLGNNDWYCSIKLDGLTLVLRYDKLGILEQAITRGNGFEGEDVTAQAKMIRGVPLKIPHEGGLEVRGECLVTWSVFNKLGDGFSHPRGYAAGSVRQLDTEITKKRCLDFVVFEVVTYIGEDDKVSCLEFANKLGFDVVQYSTANNVEMIIDEFDICRYDYPIDGLIFELRSRKESEKLGATGHHENCRIAYKFKDETYTTILRDIEWNTSRTGLINPVAIFDPVEIDGSIVEKASLHNTNIIRQLKLGIGDEIEVYKANMIIPQVDKNNTCSNTYEIPTRCPVCGSEVVYEGDYLKCGNPYCKAKIVNQLVHYCSRDCMNIDGLSEKTIERFYEIGMLDSIESIYTLESYKNKIACMSGFGMTSAKKIMESIEKSTHTELWRFINGLGIDGIGKVAAKKIAKYCGDDPIFFHGLLYGRFDWTKISGFGDSIKTSIHTYAEHMHPIRLMDIINRLDFNENKSSQVGGSLKGKTFCITGKLVEFSNRNACVNFIEKNGGKYVGSVTKNTSYLINNDVNSSSGKNATARKLGIPIISEKNLKIMVDI